jgi:hypothetical protein
LGRAFCIQFRYDCNPRLGTVCAVRSRHETSLASRRKRNRAMKLGTSRSDQAEQAYLGVRLCRFSGCISHAQLSFFATNACTKRFPPVRLANPMPFRRSHHLNASMLPSAPIPRKRMRVSTLRLFPSRIRIGGRMPGGATLLAVEALQEAQTGERPSKPVRGLEQAPKDALRPQ